MTAPDRTQAPPIQPIEDTRLIKPEEHTLPNGIPVYYIHSEKQPIFGMEVIVKSGTRDVGNRAKTWFTSKMLSEGTSQLSSSQISEGISSRGAFMQVSSGADDSVVGLYGLTRESRGLFDVLAQMLSDASFPEQELENLKAVRLQQLQVDWQRTRYRASRRFKEVIFGESHPYGMFLDEGTIRKTRRGDLTPIFNMFYKASYMEIILAGNITEQLLKDLDETIGRQVPMGGGLSDRAEMPAMGHPVFREEVHVPDSQQASIFIGRRLFPRRHPDTIPFRVLNTILGGYFGSRLMKNIREDKGLTYGIHSSVQQAREEGHFVIAADVNIDAAEEAIEEIKKEMEKLKNEPLPPDELEAVRNYMLGSFATSLDTPFAHAERFKVVHHSGLSYSYYDRFLETIRTITPEELQSFADKYLDNNIMVTVVAGDTGKL